MATRYDKDLNEINKNFNRNVNFGLLQRIAHGLFTENLTMTDIRNEIIDDYINNLNLSDNELESFLYNKYRKYINKYI